ncbi:hypothetical protein A1A1_05362 [Planococcus antarcticus DSM 14505]|uniref:DUF421 domain-containing protein n=1 Tax=Planococcus antarcticus DSM 14505 TaxID=1185653 RepID=A0A1C7DE37_9BACL|nr:YetF domain-containing protein [Planococcus antarcticus]ANU09790.1 hypothetical protein BBH88_05490 [Planococcus antarcticus DSM 14505]EIM07612.1 hypothetical protein A1A1_05362 [Planococcus antarcticus DSM 14505]
MFEITLDSFIRIVTVGFLAYVGLIVFLRISGKRTLTKLNAFDLVVTVALGSTLATILLNNSISLLEGMTAFALLIFLQYVFTLLSVHSSWFNNIIKSEPRLLFLDGQFLRSAMKKERIKEIEILQAIRNSGFGSTEKVKAVVLETDGSLSVISSETGNSLENVKSNLDSPS